MKAPPPFPLQHLIQNSCDKKINLVYLRLINEPEVNTSDLQMIKRFPEFAR